MIFSLALYPKVRCNYNLVAVVLYLEICLVDSLDIGGKRSPG